jgi:hypothetical protein
VAVARTFACEAEPVRAGCPSAIAPRTPSASDVAATTLHATTRNGRTTPLSAVSTSPPDRPSAAGERQADLNEGHSRCPPISLQLSIDSPARFFKRRSRGSSCSSCRRILPRRRLDSRSAGLWTIDRPSNDQSLCRLRRGGPSMRVTGGSQSLPPGTGRSSTRAGRAHTKEPGSRERHTH